MGYDAAVQLGTSYFPNGGRVYRMNRRLKNDGIERIGPVLWIHQTESVLKYAVQNM